MKNQLKELYRKFFTPLELPNLQEAVEQNHQALIAHLSKKDRNTVLWLIDAKDMICNLQIEHSFIQGYQLGASLTTELQEYNGRTRQESPNDCGRFFMTDKNNLRAEKEGAEDGKALA